MTTGLYAWDAAAQQAAGLRVLLRWRFADQAGCPVQGVRAVDTATHPHIAYGLYPHTDSQGRLQGLAIVRPMWIKLRHNNETPWIPRQQQMGG